MNISKDIILDIVKLCQIMADGRKNKTITVDNYSEKFKPYLTKFQNDYGDTPNLVLQKELKTFYLNHLQNVSSNILLKSFGFWGRSIYNYTWTCIYYDFGKESMAASYSPQLYIVVNKEGIKFGFCYGNQVGKDDEIVQSIFQKDKFEILKKCLQYDKELCFFNSTEEEVTASPEKLFEKEDRIKVDQDQYLKDNWSNKSLLIKEFKKDDINENIADIIQTTFYNLKEFYLSTLPIDNEIIKDPKEKLVVQIAPFDYKIFHQNSRNVGFTFSKQLINRFVASLCTKPFVILTGLSGSGKTKLAQAFAMWICENKSQYCIVPVGADWTNREPLLGFPNALDKTSYIFPDNEALNLIFESNKPENKSKPYFLILDEMNLSHVERYFADFLSVMESKESINLYAGESRKNSKDEIVLNEISWPKNLFIVGTVNVDETTYMFSPKVLDRASVIEFRVTAEEMESYLLSSKKLDLDSLKSAGVNMGASFVQIANDLELKVESIDEIQTILLNFFKELKKTGAEFGYRSASEILRFAAVVNHIETEWTMPAIIDAAIMQKLLPKVHGSRKKLEGVLLTLARLCVLDEVKKGIDFKVENLLNSEDIDSHVDKFLYPVSFEKISRMYRGLLANGFTSYAEA